jgi:diguanylate cyclase (GGDEF)-like protein
LASESHSTSRSRTALAGLASDWTCATCIPAAILVVLDGICLGDYVHLSGPTTTIGRQRGVDLHLPDPSVSRCHAVIERVHAGYFLRDLGSTNGCQVNARPTAQAGLSHGDNLRVGDVTLRFLSECSKEGCYHREVNARATLDALTGVFNRSTLLQRGEALLALAKLGATPFSALVLDVDRFKLANDRYGHAAGDCLLRGIVGQLRRGLRNDAVLGRLGGDEFVVLLPDAPGDVALAVAVRLGKLVKAMVLADYPDWQASLTIGVAHRAEVEGGLDELLRLADMRVLAGKRHGRGVVCIADQVPAVDVDVAPASAGASNAAALTAPAGR